MLDLTKAVMPSAVKVDGIFYAVHTDFRYWLSFYRLVSGGKERFLTDFDFLYSDKIPENRKEGYGALLDFAGKRNALPREVGGLGTSETIMDYDIDSDYIYAAFLEQYGIDLTECSLHWHKFRALLNGLHDTKLNEIMGYRSYNPNDKSDYKKQMRRLKEAWRIERQIDMSEEEKAMSEDFERRFT